MIDFMQSYASYFRGQTQEWFAKSVKSLAGVGSDRSDPQHATFLLDQTQPVLVAALSKYLHNPPAHVQKFIDSPGYCRSCRTFRDDGLWGQLGYHWGPLHSKNLRCTRFSARAAQVNMRQLHKLLARCPCQIHCSKRQRRCLVFIWAVLA